MQTGGAGPSIQALWPVLSAVANPQIGRNWTGTASRTIQLIREGSDYGDHNLSQLDLRASKRFDFGRNRLRVDFDVYNVFNSSWPFTVSSTYSTAAPTISPATGLPVPGTGSAWLRPTNVLQHRFFKLGGAVLVLRSPLDGDGQSEGSSHRRRPSFRCCGEHAASAEKARRVPQESLEALSQAGIFRMTAPKAYGGVEADFQTQCDVLAEIARGCPSTSWVATIYSAMSWLVGTFPDEAQQEIFATRDPRISGVFSPTGTAVAKDGGFLVNGRWGFNTGCHGANWTVLNVVVGEMPTCMIARSADLKILDDWYATGMAATGSNTIVAENVFVPGYRAMPLPHMLEAKYPDRHNARNPYFNYPLAPVLTVNAGGTPVGTARGAMDAFLERLPGRGITYTNYTNKAEAPVTHLQLAEASMKIDSARRARPPGDVRSSMERPTDR